MTKPVPLMVCALLILAACGRGDTAYPRLLPTAQALAEPTLPDHAAGGSAAIETATEAEGDALTRRAEALRRPVIEPDLRARMGL
ncbi:MAG: hypothetical protein ACU0BZ_05835 [Paracoccus sp. (in: a-proteobacteria)]|jgi:hypothetical protein|uniref:hypothetical protein n=2 Tax=Paracoccus TaxID=265 RepID=UPI000C5CBE5D|nr:MULTISPECIES: hypothetical protein [unclassified Paracoccus (in: a-proteobacteria)]MBA50175.1 hypothetical protein [Paracoccus sp. (in: a-proteobacteria)]MDB2552420.1 hypothetical protein [Paracoccus sp. (in: a-proteobacteria)]|tara:strand:+ start:280 stop:534 length:255 start_codon:yes stop_codon:yes gene_type:complete